MKIARVLFKGREFYAEVKDECVRLIEGNIFSAYKKTTKILSFSEVTFLPPVEPRQIVGIGLNYRDHAYESKMALPKEPVIFLKGPNAITGHNSAIILPKIAPNEVDYEAELVIVIKKECKNVSEEKAEDYILGYTCGNDISARDCQFRRDKQWARAKSFDTFAPIGPWIVTDLNPENLNIKLILNGKIMQDSNTSKMIFNCKKLVSFVSQCMKLYPGSIIMTGTPEGVGFSRTPPIFLREGDIVTVEIEKIGKLQNYVEKEK